MSILSLGPVIIRDNRWQPIQGRRRRQVYDDMPSVQISKLVHFCEFKTDPNERTYLPT